MWISSYAWFIGSDLEHECTLNNNTYHFEIQREPKEHKVKYNETVLTEGEVTNVIVSPYISIPDLEKYNKLYQVKNLIYTHFEKNGGSCKEYIPND